jgi:hypothetical protein
MSIPLGNIRSSNKLQVSALEREDSILLKSSDGKDMQISKTDFRTAMFDNGTGGIEIVMGGRMDSTGGDIIMGARV